MPILTEQERIGTLLAGRYQLDAILGTGGTGVVFDATHNWTGRKVAVKLLKPEYSRDLQLTRRFLQEARAAAGLSHPNVVQVLDMGSENDGTVHLVLERLDGQSLGAHLEEEGRLGAEATLALLVPIMDALVLAHRQGIIHRDLKPDNIYLHQDGAGRSAPKLLDFGMSKMVDAAWGTATSTGTLVGTPFYMSPEQAEGRKDQGPSSDVWSMGVILYRCLTGALPFYADTPTKLLIEIVKAKPKPVRERSPDVPEAIAKVVDRCLIDDRAERWESMEALLEALEQAAETAGVAFPALPDVDGMQKPKAFDPGPRREVRPSRRGALITVAALVTALALAGAVWAAQTPEPLAASNTDSETDLETDSETESVTESESVTEMDTESVTESESETEPPREGSGSATSESESESVSRTAPPPETPHPHMRTARATMATSDTTPTKATMGMRLPGVAEEW